MRKALEMNTSCDLIGIELLETLDSLLVTISSGLGRWKDNDEAIELAR